MSMTTIRTCAAALALCAASAASAQGIQRVEQPYVEKPQLPIAPAARPIPAAVPAPRPAAPVYSLEAADKTVRVAFARWAKDRGAQVQWLINDDVPIDGTGPVRNTHPELPPQAFAGSAYPDLVEAMTVVAMAFSHTRLPFVIREHDNVILVQSRASARK